jgi:hypothetical protein
MTAERRLGLHGVQVEFRHPVSSTGFRGDGFH